MTRHRAAASGAAGLLVVACALVTLSGCGVGPSTPAASPMWEREGLRGAVRPAMGSPQPGDAAPDFELPSLAGGFVRLSALRGSWIVLHFTATWCPYCDAEIAHLGELSAEYAPRNVKVLVVDLQEDPGVWSAYAAQRVAPSLFALQDRTGAAAARFAPPRAQPSFTDRAQVLFDATLVIDPAGIIRVFLLPDTAHFDPTFQGVRAELERQQRSPRRAPPLPSPSHVLPPEQVVDVSASARAPAASNLDGQVVVRLAIAPGYHVMSNRPPDPFSIPTQVAASADGLAFDAAAYPVAKALGPLSIFDGAPEVVLPFHRVEGKASAGAIAVDVRYQACTETQCLAPVRKRLEVLVP